MIPTQDVFCELRSWSYNYEKGGSMQIPGILLALLFGLASLGAAPASDQSQAVPGSVAPSVKLDLLDSTAEASPIGKFHPANERLRNFDLRNLGSIHIEGTPTSDPPVASQATATRAAFHVGRHPLSTFPDGSRTDHSRAS